MTPAWPAGAVTGLGSLPGTDPVEAARLVLGELPDLPHLPELPARGPGADLIGRGAALLVDLPVELYAARWRLTARRGRDARRTADLWTRDLDALTDVAAEYAGPLKVQAAGPWTLAAGVELPIGGVLLRDPGAVRDLGVSLAEGLRTHVAEGTARVPGARVILQLDEPTLPAVLAGRVRTESGLSRLPAPEAATATDVLRGVVDAVGVPVVVHCCAADVPVALLRRAGVAGIGLDLSLVTDLDPVGEALDAGLGLFAGAVPTTPAAGGRPPTSKDAADRVRRLWRDLGLPLGRLPVQTVVTPTCGLAGATAEYARTARRACREAARRLSEAD